MNINSDCRIDIYLYCQIPVTDSIKRYQTLRRTTGLLEKSLSDFSLDEGENSTENKSGQKNDKNIIFHSSSSDDDDEDEVSQEYQYSSKF